MRERHPAEKTTQEDEARMQQPRPNSSESSEPRQTRERDPRLERISARAHELYEARGGTDGRDLDDWLQAERDIDRSDQP